MLVVATVPYCLTRLGVVMTPEPGNPLEAWGVLNPASGRTPDGRLHLLPRIVAEGNVSRVGFAEVVVMGGVPVGVERRGVALAPDEGWERGADNSGVEDPRVTWVPSLAGHVMTYVAFGPLGPRLALAVSDDLERWRRLGPVQFTYQPDLGTDLCMFPNKDAVFFPEPVPDPDGRMCFAMPHRPMWDLGRVRPGQSEHPSRVIARTDLPILAPETADERHGLVSNVVFPTAIESIDGVRYVFYGMADAKIGVDRLDHTAPSTSL